MKKQLLFCSIFLFVILIINIPSFATFEISNFNINAQVLSNGDMEVVETIQYYSNEQDRGIVRDIGIVNSTSAINSAYGMTLEKVSVDNQLYTFSETGRIGSYTYNISPDGYEIKVYPPYYKNDYVVRYQYVLHNVAVEYSDTAEVFWNFIEEDFDYNINSLNIEIFLPESYISREEIEVFGNGLKNLDIQQQSRYVVLRAQNIDAHQLIGARILFPEYTLSDCKKFVSDDMIEDSYVVETVVSEKESEDVLFGLSITEIAVMLDIILIITMVSSYILFDKEDKIENIKYFRELPNNLSPELLQYIYCGKAKSNSFYIGVLNLIKLGVYRLEKAINSEGKETQKIIFVSDSLDTPLKKYQLSMINTINECLDIDEIGRKSLELSVLEERLTILGKEGFCDFEKFLKSESEDLAGKVAKTPKRVVAASAFAMISLIIFIVMMATAISDFEEVSVLAFLLGFTTFVYSLAFSSLGNSISTWGFMIFHAACFQIANIMFMWQCGIIALYPTYLLMFIYIQYLIRIKKYPKEERQTIAYLNGLKRYIRDFPINREENVPLWEDYFMISVAFGFNSKTLNYFYNYGKKQNSNLGVSLRNTTSYTDFNYIMHSTFNLHRKSNA